MQIGNLLMPMVYLVTSITRIGREEYLAASYFSSNLQQVTSSHEEVGDWSVTAWQLGGHQALTSIISWEMSFDF